MPKTYYPTTAQQAAMENLVAVGQELDSNQQAGYLWASGLSDRDFNKILIYKLINEANRYFLHVFFETFQNRSFPTYQQEYEWREMGKTRFGITVSTVDSGDTTTSLVFTSTTTIRRNQINDVIQSPRGWTARITAHGVGAGSAITYTIEKIDGTAWSIAVGSEVVAGDVLGFSHNMWGEKTGQPESMRYFPEIKSNKLMIMKATSSYSGDAVTNRTELDLPNGQRAWVTEQQWMASLEFLRTIENSYMWSQESIAGATILSTRGIVPDLKANAAVQTTYTGTLDQNDFISTFYSFNTLNANMEWTLLCGQEIEKDATNANKEYFVNGGVKFGEFDTRKKLSVGLGVSQYSFAGRNLNLVNYKNFDDEDVTGNAGAAAAGIIDYHKFAMVLNMGKNGGRAGGVGADRAGRESIPFFSCRYKALGSVNRKMVAGFLKGMTGEDMLGVPGLDGQTINSLGMGNYVASDIDESKFFLLTQQGVQMPAVDTAHALIYAIG